MNHRSFDPLLYLVTDRGLCQGRELHRVVDEAVSGGVTMVQLREKSASFSEFLELAWMLKAILDRTDVPLIINDNVEVARRVQAHGVHLGQSDMGVGEARKILGPSAIIGLSVENFDQAQAAEGLDVDYLGVSPIFPTSSKKDVGSPWGIGGLIRLRALSRHVLVGIGGITSKNAGTVIQAGVQGVAVVSALCSADSIRGAALDLQKIVQRARNNSENIT